MTRLIFPWPLAPLLALLWFGCAGDDPGFATDDDVAPDDDTAADDDTDDDAGDDDTLPAGAHVEILYQNIDGSHEGITVMRVWGSRYEMGHGIGVAMAPDLVYGVDYIRDIGGAYYDILRGIIEGTNWLPEGIDEELAGMVAGIQEVEPGAEVDAVDLKIINTYGDWSHALSCRSHSCWGSLAGGGFTTLSTRRLDYGVPYGLPMHHVLCAFEPDDGSPRWVNFGFPGFVTVATGLNEYGTLVSLHNYNTTFTAAAGATPRCVAARHALTGMDPALPIEDHLGWAAAELGQLTISTGTFINVYAPDGHGGVLTCPMGEPCGALRRPQAGYFGGEVLITTNAETDGLSAPYEGEFIEDYYLAGGPMDLEGHYELLGHDGMQLMSVGYRGPGDMAVWVEGHVSGGVTERVEFEWSELFGP